MDFGAWNLSLLLILLVAFALGVFSAGTMNELSRLAYALRIIPLSLIKVFVFANMPVGGEGVGFVANVSVLGGLFFLAPALTFLECRWSALRLNQIGWSRWLALLTAIPLVNLLFLLVLLVVPGNRLALARA